MSLYSHNLSGLVVLTDCNLDEDSPRDTTEKVSDICSRSTEYHFPSFDQQLESLKLKTGAPNNKLKCGDFYMTRHSNLCEVHVLFHMLSATTNDDGEDYSPLTSADKVNSRHPVVMGLRRYNLQLADTSYSYCVCCITLICFFRSTLDL